MLHCRTLLIRISGKALWIMDLWPDITEAAILLQRKTLMVTVMDLRAHLTEMRENSVQTEEMALRMTLKMDPGNKGLL